MPLLWQANLLYLRQLMANSISTLTSGLLFPESPRWRDDRLWFVDMMAGEVKTVTMAGEVDTIATASPMISGIDWTPDGQLLLVSMREQKLLRLNDAGWTEVADMSEVARYYCNDMVVDHLGRAYVGDVGFDAPGGAPYQPGHLMLVQPDGDVTSVDPELGSPNGMVITPDGKTLIVAESAGQRHTAYTIAADGALHDKRVWADHPGDTPDGICLDAEGCIWAAFPMQGEVRRLREGGEVLERIANLAPLPLAVALGGPYGNTLFILQAPHPSMATGRPQGLISMQQVDVPGAPLRSQRTI